jgi:ribosomal protein L39E
MRAIRQGLPVPGWRVLKKSVPSFNARNSRNWHNKRLVVGLSSHIFAGKTAQLQT